MKKLRFLVSLMTKNNDYQLEQAAAAQQAAAQLDVDAQILFGDNDPITQSTQVLKAIQAEPTERPDAIVCEPVGATALPQVARAAGSAGIGWAILNRDAEYLAELRKTCSAPLFSVSSEQTEVGRIEGRQFVALLPRGGAVLYIQGPSESVVAKGRFTGMQKTISPNIQITTLRGQWTEDSAHRSVSSWLRLSSSSRTPIDLIGAQNDAMAMGARRAFDEITNASEKERWLRLPITGIDGVPKTGQTWVRTGALTATIITPPSAGQAIYMMVQAMKTGSKPPERSYTVAESFPPLDKLSAK
jgi:ABC-type sugar transport system substrate-binding protein